MFVDKIPQVLIKIISLYLMRDQQLYLTKKGYKSFLSYTKRREKFRQKKAGYQRYLLHMKRRAEAEGRSYKSSLSNPFIHKKALPPKPEYPLNIKYLLSIPDFFSKKQFTHKDDGVFYIPECFSLLENYEESFDFLKRLFVVLHKCKCRSITLDYSKCKRIDVDASICMDVLLIEFIKHVEKCRKLGYRNLFDGGITPINFQNPDIMKVLFSIGAYRNIRGFSIKYADVEALPVLVNDHRKPEVWERSEIDQTKIVEYIKRCLKRLGRELTIEAETSFYKVIGEVMSNAEEHATMPYRFAIGFFQETHNEEEHFGIFNFSIFNFGNTIYETFKSPECPNQKTVKQMTDLSEDYTKKGWFSKADFEEETLWSLYALQDGVTSKKKKRGNGSIQYLENFFKLKGDLNKDNISKFVIVSGNTRIMFDGSYEIKEKLRIEENRKYKSITFNDSGEIFDQPNKKYVTFAPHFFPGTLISARILIKFDNTTSEQPNGE
ncbi:MAG TPA: hypothetical protein VF868_05435 [Bacteroidia bacterium]|jgi:hypothetical protein